MVANGSVLISDDEFKDFLGQNAYKFFSAKDRALRGKNVWSWSAFFFPLFWAAYYKWYVAAGVIALVNIAAIECLGTFALPAFYLSSLVISIVAGITFKSAYIRHAFSKIAEFKAVESNPQRLKDLLQRHGGSSAFNVFLAFMYFGLLAVAQTHALNGQLGTLMTSNLPVFSGSNSPKEAVVEQDQSGSLGVPVTADHFLQSQGAAPSSSENNEGVPLCDAADSIGLVKGKLNEELHNQAVNMAAAYNWEYKVASDEVIDIDNAFELAFEADNQTRHCKGVAEATISGKRTILYDLRALHDGTVGITVAVEPASASNNTHDFATVREIKPSSPAKQTVRPTVGVPVSADEFLQHAKAPTGADSDGSRYDDDGDEDKIDTGSH